MIFNRRTVIYYSPDSDGGGGVEPPAEPNPAEINPPVVSEPPQGNQAAQNNPPAGDTPPEQSAPPAEGASNAMENWKSGNYVEDKPLLYQLPDQNKDPEGYWNAFDKLSYEQQQQVEQEVVKLNDGSDQDLRNLMQQKLEGKPEEQAPPAKSSKESNEPEDFQEWTPEEWSKLDEKSKANVRVLQEASKELQPFLDEHFQKGVHLMETDPVIQGRIKEIQTGVSAPDAENFDYTSVASDADLAELGVPEEALEKVGELIKTAHNQGFQTAHNKGLIASREKEIHLQRTYKFQGELKQLQANNKSLQSDLSLKDSKHPLNPFIQFVRDTYTENDMDRFSVEEMYELYHKRTGGAENAAQKVRQNAFLTITKNLKDLDNAAATNTPGNSGSTPTRQGGGVVWQGIDMKRYNSDFAYREEMFEKADYQTQKHLENYVATGRLPA